MTNLIKRYKNRKLYNTVTHRYMSMTELADAASHGCQLTIVEHHTGKDVTDVTLKRAAFEKAKQTERMTFKDPSDPHNTASETITNGGSSQ